MWVRILSAFASSSSVSCSSDATAVSPRPAKVPHTAVASHLIVLDALHRSDQRGIFHVRVAAEPDHLFAFSDQPLHGFAGLTGWLDFKQPKSFVESRFVLPRLDEMSLKSDLELRICCRFGHFGECLDKLFLGTTEIRNCSSRTLRRLVRVISVPSILENQDEIPICQVPFLVESVS